ncbi:hypothetical protein ABPG74_014571 [Tetrahymena malaccensis]
MKQRSQSATVKSASDMTVRQMFDVATRNQIWGIEGYEISRKYVDPQKQIKDREFAELRDKNKLPTKNKNYVTKRGHFYNDLEKQFKGYPGPNKYKLDYVWVSQNDIEKGRKKPHDTKKNTYIDNIIDESKKRPVPGPGKYNITKTEEQIKKEVQEMKSKKIKQGERVDFLCEYQYVAAQTPGPGQYNGREIQPKLQANRTKPDDWINKHKAEGKKRIKSAFPDVGTYKPILFNTFSKIEEMKQKQGTRPKSNYLGTAERFGGSSKKSKTSGPPGPGQYPLIANWPGKEEGKKKDSKAKNWMYNITKGTSEVRSIYY